MKTELSQNHKSLEDAYATRRYFAKFERIISHLDQVAQLVTGSGQLADEEVVIVRGYLGALSRTFTALSHKYLMSGRVSDSMPSSLDIDTVDSGFPIYQELLQMANDALQADRHLANQPSVKHLKRDMIRHIMNEHTSPTKLQFALAQRLYYEQLAARNLFWAQNDPQIVWRGNSEEQRRHYLVHWASYDSQVNIPTVYLMLVEDSGRTALPRDEQRWPQVQGHLMAQAVASLKLVTIARGFDRDFDDLHPKMLRRIHVGPMYSHAYTRQNGPLRDVLAEARGKAGNDWALAWTIESLHSDRVETEKSGWFGTVEREIFKLDHFGQSEAETGASDVRRSLILPQRPFQVLEEKDPPGMRGVRKYVVADNGQVVSYK